MDELLAKQNIEVAAVDDRVLLRLGRLEIPIPYATAFRIAQAFQVASKEAMRMTGEDRSNWRERAQIDHFPSAPPLFHGKRQTLPAKFDWSIAFNSEIVTLTTGDISNSFHFSVALKLSDWLRRAGKAAKRWAGDTGRHLSAMGSLTDAEQNYRYGRN